MEYRYAVYFKWKDGVEDSFNCVDARERDYNIKEMKDRNDFCSIEWSHIYADGEYGKRHKVL